MTELVDRLRELVGDANVVTGADLEPHLTDARGESTGTAIAAVRPGTTDEVAAVIRALDGADVAVVTQGGNTGMSGGSVPFDDRPSVIVVLTRMRRIRAWDAVTGTITVEAGVTIEALQDTARAHGGSFAPDWGARGTATIGGAISTNAGGTNVLRFGTMRDHVLGLEVVLPDGRVWDGLRSLRKDSSGLDLKQLFIGAEGTLGIVTAAVVRLEPERPHVRSALASLRALNFLDELLARARAAGGDLTAFELMPGHGIDLATEKLGIAHPLATRADWYVLVRFAGTTPVDDHLTEFLAAAAADDLVADAVVAATADQEEQLWLLRDELSPPALFGPGVDSVKMDTAVPLGAVTAFVGGVADIAARLAPGSTPFCFGHVGDGNIHAHVLPPDDLTAWAGQKPAVQQALDELTWQLRGTISAEHGIGRALVGRVAAQKPALELELAAAIKSLLDPDHRFNPGKTFPTPRASRR